jgi:hypothetical protein
MRAVDDRLALRETQAWLKRAVIGLNLCPFANAPLVRDRVRFVVSAAATDDELLVALGDELDLLVARDESEIETTLLIHPHLLDDYYAFNDFLAEADAVLVARELEGVVQIASFHPRYQFAGTEVDDPGNATNRSPYPTLHLLRESSVARAVAAVPDTAAIVAANIATLERLGPDGWSAIRQACRDDARQTPDR